VHSRHLLTKGTLLILEAGSEIRDATQALFKWDGCRDFQFFLLELAKKIDYTTSLGADYDKIKKLAGEQYPYHPFPDVRMPDGNSPSIRVSIPPTMASAANIETFNQFCITLDGYVGVTVPMRAAEVVSGSFITGLVTRLVLEMSTKRGDDDLSGIRYKRKIETDRSRWISPGNSKMEDFLRKISQDGLLTTAGIFHGWTFGGNLARRADPAYTAIMWKLLKSRFSWAEIGDLTGYGLNYLIGFLRCQLALSTVEKGGTADLNKIRELLIKDERTHDTEKVVCDFFDAFLSLAPAILGSRARSPFLDFVKGFQRGGLRSSEAVFVLALNAGYGIGYRDGYQAGYARGYADGYAAGYEDGTSTVGGIFQGLVKEISNFETAATVVSFFL